MEVRNAGWKYAAHLKEEKLQQSKWIMLKKKREEKNGHS